MCSMGFNLGVFDVLLAEVCLQQPQQEVRVRLRTELQRLTLEATVEAVPRGVGLGSVDFLCVQDDVY